MIGQAIAVRASRRIWLVGLAAAVCSVGPGSWTAQAQDVGDFFRGRTLTINVGVSPGGAYDIYTRLVARHMGRFIPGQPTTIVRNMPGAGGLNAANHIFARAPKDGTEMAVFSRSLVTQKLFDPQGIAFDAEQLGWIGTPMREVSVVFAWATKPFKSLQDLRDRPMLVSATAGGADSAVMPYMVNSVLGTKIKVVTGYPGAAETMMAIERGEVDGSGSTSWSNFTSAKKAWIDEKKVTILLQMGMAKHPAIPDVPSLLDLVSNEVDRKAVELILVRQEMAYPITAPPGLPADRLQALRRAFDQVMTDAAAKEDAAQQSLELDPIAGEKLSNLLKQAFSSPPEVIARAKDLVSGGSK